MSKRAKRVLLTSASFDRAYGGIAICVARLAKELSDKGIEIGLWAPDGSAKSSDVIAKELPDSVRLAGSLDEALRTFPNPDIIHDNGIWLPHNHALSEAATQNDIPRVVSVHGMLEPWALQHRRLKKWAAWRLYQKRDLNSAQLLHATANTELNSIEQMKVSNEIVVIPNGTDVPDLSPKKQETDKKRVMLFLSRIHPKKGLPMLLNAWAKLKPSDWELRIAGPDENGHRNDIEALTSKLELDAVVSFLGPLNGAQVSDAYMAADAFVLPTHSENFGLVVTEALAHSIPVLTTTATPWDELESKECGWFVPPTELGIETGLSRVFGSSISELHDMGQRGRTLVANKYAWAPVADRFVDSYERVLSEYRKPIRT